MLRLSLHSKWQIVKPFTKLGQEVQEKMVDRYVKDWFLDYNECMKVTHKWNMMQSWRRAQEMLPSLLKDVHEASRLQVDA